VYGSDCIGSRSIHQAHPIQAVQLRDVHDLLAFVSMGRDSLSANGLHYLYRNGTTHAATNLAQMAGNVLTEDERAWLQERAAIIRSLAAAEFSGDVPVDERHIYERLAQKTIGFSFMVCWTCGASLKNLGTYLQTTLEP
jgi:hypothetical protein